jgi:hypothetical protein
MKRLLISFLVIMFFVSNLYASQSTITEADGYSCMGYDKSKKQTEEEALANAKRKAVEYASTYIKSQTLVKNFQLEKDLIDAYANATVKIIQELERAWYKDASSGDCFRVKVKAEVVPDDQAMSRISKGQGVIDDPSALLQVSVWTDKKEYRQSEKIKIYIKGNKPFYTRVVYKDAKGTLIQLLPNPYRMNAYFNGGVIYEIPSGEDKFELEVTPPFGSECIMVYASTSDLGEIDLTPVGGIYQIKTSPEIIGKVTRGIALKAKSLDEKGKAAEFSETEIVLKTGK